MGIREGLALTGRPEYVPAILFQPASHQDPTPPLYHTTKVLACQAPQMLNFCYKCVTKVLRYITFLLQKYYAPVTYRRLIPQ